MSENLEQEVIDEIPFEEIDTELALQAIKEVMEE
jgi:hypothetical protein